MEFKQLSEITEIDQIVNLSNEKLQIIFKHSTVCPISRMSLEKMKKEYTLFENEADIYYVGVIEQRPISNFISEKLNVKHESPQMILIKGGIAVFDESHLMINPEILKEWV